MNLQPAPPVVLTTARIRRVRALYCPEDGPPTPFATGCPYCGLHGALHRPCAGGRSWSVRCRSCGARTFVQHPRQLFAPSTVIARVGEQAPDRLIRFMTRLDQLGNRRLMQIPWESAIVAGRTIQQLAVGQACLSCGEPASLMVRRDRHGRPYGSCAACTARTFWRHTGGLLTTLGWTAWLTQPGHDAAWWEAFQLGKQQWSAWMAPLQEDATRNAAPTASNPRQETA